MNKNYKPLLQPRDRLIFRDLIESRVMTLAQISMLHFDGHYEYAKKRLQQFKAVSYITERKPRHNPGYYFSSMLSLARPGFQAVADDPLVQAEHMTWLDLASRLDLAESTLAHELEVVDMKVAFLCALREAEHLTVEEFSTYPRRYQFATEHVASGKLMTLKPDAYARVIRNGDEEYDFFFEWDRSSEAHRRLAAKAYGYQRYDDSGAFAMWNGAPPEARAEYPFSSIFILPNEERRNNAAEELLRLRHPKTGAQVLRRMPLLLTTHAEFLRDPLGPIYITLPAYRAATAGTPFSPEAHKALMRVKQRDRLVAGQIQKYSLFGGV